MTPSKRWLDLVLPIGIIACVMVILVPLPPAILDVLLAANITIAVIVLLTTIQVKTPLEFAIFPTLLLATTLGRVVLNIATTRLILSRGAIDNSAAAGGVIQSFGEFVAGDYIAVGAVIFAIILIVQFVVITKGATRISEVAARFTLDGMPGRQMAIDADLNAGTIDAETACLRRDDLQAQADFYGTMDGASKYVRGDAIAGLLITAINIVGGLAIGLGSGMSLAQAADVFTRLTIGDGLVTQIPGLLISLAAGILVSRSTRSSDLSADFVTQLFSRPQVLLVAGGFLFVLMFTRMPALPLLAVGSICVVGAWFASARNGSEPIEKPKSPEPDSGHSKAEPDFSRFLAVDPIEIELGVNLISLASGGQLLPRITGARQAMADELGVVLPKIRVRDNLQLQPDEFQILIHQLPVCQDLVHMDRVLLVRKTPAAADPGGHAATWHSGCGASWVRPESSSARGREYLRLEPAEMIVETLKQQSRLRASEILTRQSTAFLIEQLRETNPTTVQELIPDVMKIGRIQQILQRLLSQGITIKPLNTILEALADHYEPGIGNDVLCERVRGRLSPWITARLRDAQGIVRVVQLDEDLKLWLGGCLVVDEGQRQLSVDESAVERLQESIAGILRKEVATTRPIGLVVPGQLRAPLQQLLNLPSTRVLLITGDEISADAKIETIAILQSSAVRYVAA